MVLLINTQNPGGVGNSSQGWTAINAYQYGTGQGSCVDSWF